ncbi:carboxypeptidase-like regulatory domain-containing protein [Sphaerotilaceae bacterium SBD11-9]
MKAITPWLAAVASTFVLVACGGADNASDGASVTGLVVEMDTGAPVAGARVSAGRVNTQTANDGRFTLSGLAASEHLPVQVEAAGHGSKTALVRLPADGSATLRVRLLRLGLVQAFNAETGTMLIAPGSTAQAQVPGDSLVDAQTGTPVLGAVNASLTHLDPASDPERMPGSCTTLQAGEVRAIESFGAIHVDLRNPASRRLQLAPGTDARIRIPLSTHSPNPPAEAPLFHFDLASGRWVKEGVALLRTAPNGDRYYQGEVTHYSYWSAAIESETVDVEGCTQRTDGSPATGATRAATP